MRTAYELAHNPFMPHSHFEILVKCQRQNGVRLVEGRHNNKAGILLYILLKINRFYTIVKLFSEYFHTHLQILIV